MILQIKCRKWIGVVRTTTGMNGLEREESENGIVSKQVSGLQLFKLCVSKKLQNFTLLQWRYGRHWRAFSGACAKIDPKNSKAALYGVYKRNFCLIIQQCLQFEWTIAARCNSFPFTGKSRLFGRRLDATLLSRHSLVLGAPSANLLRSTASLVSAEFARFSPRLE